MIAHPSFVAQVQGEVYKWRRHRLYQSLLAMPLILVATITLALIIFGRRSSSPVEDTAVISSIGNVDFGSRSGFTMASALLFAFFGNFYWLGFMVAYVWAVANEFNWKTIKMIATRQPSRPVIVLSKIAFAGLFTVAMYGTFIAAWFILAMFFRWYYPARDPLFNPTDLDAFVKGLSYFAKFCLSVWIWGCLGIAVGVIGKSIVGGVLVTVLVNGLDLSISGVGALAINIPTSINDSFFGAIAALARTLYPYLLNSSINRLMLEPTSQQVVASMPEYYAWFVLAVYAIGFTLIGVVAMARRDILD